MANNVLCPTCGRTATSIGDQVLNLVRQSRDAVSSADVAVQLGMNRHAAGAALCALMERGLIVRVRHGWYGADPELRRRALLDELDQLTTG